MVKAAGVPFHYKPSGGWTASAQDWKTAGRELARLRAGVAELETAERKLNTKRNIHRAAAR